MSHSSHVLTPLPLCLFKYPPLSLSSSSLSLYPSGLYLTSFWSPYFFPHCSLPLSSPPLISPLLLFPPSYLQHLPPSLTLLSTFPLPFSFHQQVCEIVHYRSVVPVTSPSEGTQRRPGAALCRCQHQLYSWSPIQRSIQYKNCPFLFR